jgi:hypothetical protein
MSMREVIGDVVQRYDEGVRKVIIGVIAAEQEKIDMDRPRGIQRDIERVIDEQVRREEKANDLEPDA